tara:strand:+ start:89 stop:1045 length:957 start_codon:yes stop_codon:yes gene_type:complete
MKKIFLSLCFFTSFSFAQNTVTDIDNNIYEHLAYGIQFWTVDNAAMETYRDGTPIPQVIDVTAWSNLTTGAWCYYKNDPSKSKLYNWYAVMGIHDNEASTPNKELAPEGWHVPSHTEWTTLEEYLIAESYNYDSTITGNKIAKAMASTTGWNTSTNEGAPGNDQSANNSSGFNAFPQSFRYISGGFNGEGGMVLFWNSTNFGSDTAWSRVLGNSSSNLVRNSYFGKRSGFSVRFVRDANTASVGDYNLKNTIYPNPVSSTLFIDNNAITTVKIVDLQGRMLIETNSKQINVSTLTNGTYLVNLYDDHNYLQTFKIIKR